MSRTKHSPYWDKTNGHGFWKKMMNKKIRRVSKTEKPVIKKSMHAND